MSLLLSIAMRLLTAVATIPLAPSLTESALITPSSPIPSEPWPTANVPSAWLSMLMSPLSENALAVMTSWIPVASPANASPPSTSVTSSTLPTSIASTAPLVSMLVPAWLKIETSPAQTASMPAAAELTLVGNWSPGTTVRSTGATRSRVLDHLTEDALIAAICRRAHGWPFRSCTYPRPG